MIFAAAACILAAVPDLSELQRMASRFAPVNIEADVSRLSEGDRKALVKLVQIDYLFLAQYWRGNPELWQKLRADTTPLGRARAEYFWLNKGPWSALDHHVAFLPGVPEKKVPGSNFYPEDMSKAEFETWVKTLPADARREAEGFFTVVRRVDGKLTAVPYSREYKEPLARLAALLREAAALTGNASLRRYLEARAAAFLSNDYYASDVAWMDLDAPIDVTIGPYETYNDELFGYKAAFEAFITLQDEAETRKVRFFSDHLQEIENNLPIAAVYKNPKLGALAPIRVVNELIASGDAAHGVRTAAFNLPNDERVIREKGSKRVMLKNVQQAKFKAILQPIASRVLDKAAQKHLSFDAFFTHILAHELTHGIGPHHIRSSGGESTPRQALKELYSAVEEAKADITGLFMLRYMMDKKMLPDTREQMYTTFLASAFRTLRFGIGEAHGRGMAVQLNYLLDAGAFAVNPGGTFRVVPERMHAGVGNLAHDLLTIEGSGDYAAAKKMLDRLAVVRPVVQAALDRLNDLPTDIHPKHVTAESLVPAAPSGSRL
jgi:hypothetical protein